jgi:hypothetical protein
LDLTASFLAHTTAALVKIRAAQIFEKGERADESFSQKCTNKQHYPGNTEKNNDC